MQKTNSNLLHISTSNQVEQPKANSDSRFLKIQYINQTVGYLICLNISCICLIELQNYILGIIMLIDIIMICYLKFLKNSQLNSSQSQNELNNTQNSKKTDLTDQPNPRQIKKSQPSLQEQQYFEFTLLGLVATLYIAAVEIMISISKEKNFYIIISMFLSLFSSIQNKNIKNDKICFGFIFIQQTYTLLRLQISLEFDYYSLITNILYYIYQISYQNVPIQKFSQNDETTNDSLKDLNINNSTSTTELVMRLYQSILQLIPEGIAVLNSEKKMLYANPTLKKILQSNKREELQQILMNLGNSQANENKENFDNMKQAPILPSQLKSQYKKASSKTNVEKSVQKNYINFQHKTMGSNTNRQSSLDKANDLKKSSNENLYIQGNINMSEQIKINSAFKKSFHGSLRQHTPDQQENSRKEVANQFYTIGSNTMKTISQKKNTIIYQRGSSTCDQIGEQNKSQILMKKDNRLGTKLDFNQRLKQGLFNQTKSQPIQNNQNTSDQSEILSVKGFFDDGIKSQSSREFSQLPIQSGSYSYMPNNEQISGQQISPQTRAKQYQGVMKKQLKDNNDINIQLHLPSQQKSPGPLKFQDQNDQQSSIKTNENLQPLQPSIQKVDSEENCEQKSDDKKPYKIKFQNENNQSTIDIQQQEINITKLKENLVKQKQQMNQQKPIKSKNINYQKNLSLQNINNIKPHHETIEQSNNQKILQNNSQQVINKSHSLKKPLQTNIPFTLKVKPKNPTLQKIDNQIVLEKTDVSNILDKMFDESSIKRKIQKDVNDKSQNEKNENSGINNNAKSLHHLQSQNSKDENNNQKGKSFLSQIQKSGEFDLSYIQHTEDVTKIQVKYKGKDLVIQFLLVDVYAENSKKDPLVLVLVQDLWQDLYQRKVQDIQKDKMRVFASLSHELRTPLNCSISMLEVLIDELSEFNPSCIDEYINPALFSNKLLLNQINDILDFVQMDSGKFKYSFYDFSVIGLLKDCQKLVSMQAQMKQIELRISYEDDIPEYICSDPNRIRQIILNFLSNSLKFTKMGYIELGIQSSSNGQYQIFVRDTGIGITKENLDTIFDFCGKIKYQKNDGDLNRQGCGLGLTISNQIAKGLIKQQDLSRGIIVESDYGYGSKFSIIIEDMNYKQKTNGPKSVDLSSPNKPRDKFSRFTEIKDEEIQSSNVNKKSTYTPSLKVRDQRTFINSSYIITEDENSFVDTLNTTQNPINNQLENRSAFNRLRHYENNNQQTMNSIETTLNTQTYGNIQLKPSDFIDSADILDEQEDKNSPKSSQFQQSQPIKVPSYFKQDQSQDQKQFSPQDTKKNKKKQSNTIKHSNTPLKLGETNQITQSDSLNNINFTNNSIYSQLINQNNSSSNIKSNLINSSNGFNYYDLQNIGRTHDMSSVSEEKNTELESNFNPKKLSFANQSSANISSNMKMAIQSSKSQQMNMEQEGFTSYVGFSKQIDFSQSSTQNLSQYSQVLDVQKNPKQNINKQFQQITSEYETNTCMKQQQIIDQIVDRNNLRQLQCKCPQILVVDDNQFNLYALTKTVQSFYFKIAQASDGNNAIEKVKQQFFQNCCKAPKMIFMDIEMPFKNGYETTIEINKFYKSVQLEQPPIIVACTAYVGQEDHDKAIEAGMDDFINKPILKKAFSDLILNWSSQFI